MSDQLEQAMAELVQKATAGVDFAIEQAPSVVQEFLLWERTLAIILFVATCAAAYAFCYGVRQLLLSHEITVELGDRYSRDEEVVAGIKGLIASIFGLIAGAILLAGFIDKLSAVVAPKWHIVRAFIG